MIPNPIHKALSTFRKCNARFLVMGGQACVLYGAAEFSRDLDLAVALTSENLLAIEESLAQLEAENVFYPPLDAGALRRGHACHFRCRASGAAGLRVDLMARMRGCPEFDALWDRRAIFELPEHDELDALSLPDLVQAKKTQCEKDWPMIRRLIEADMLTFEKQADESRVRFWLRECRTPEALVELVKKRPDLSRSLASDRPLLSFALKGGLEALANALDDEEAAEKAIDREYWRPLRQELEMWRRREIQNSQ